LSLAAGLALALASACALNWGWVAQHGAASTLPALTLRRPAVSLRLLFRDRRWLVGFSVGIGGWVLYVAALALAPLSLVQAVSAGGIGVLALLVQRASDTPLAQREWIAVGVSITGLVLLAGSLAGGSGAGRSATGLAVLAWLGLSAVAAAFAAGTLAPLIVGGAGLGLAAGILYAAGDLATKAAVGGGLWLALVPAVLAAHGLAFVCLQLGFQRGGALATAGASTVLTNALPIAGGIVLFHERVPGGALGALRVAAFALVVAGAAAFARGEVVASIPLTDESISA
jgi:hypothetical protein